MDIYKPRTHAEILDLWPSLPTVARDIGFKYMAVWKWNKRNFVPPEYWCALVDAAHNRDIDISFKLLAETVRDRYYPETIVDDPTSKPLNKQLI